jgi:hypothetical protein
VAGVDPCNEFHSGHHHAAIDERRKVTTCVWQQ